jgi:hypothetical protein
MEHIKVVFLSSVVPNALGSGGVQLGWTFTSCEFDFNPENVFQEYRQRYRKLFSSSPEIKIERAGFLQFWGTHRLTLEGRLFLMAFRGKGLICRCVSGTLAWT